MAGTTRMNREQFAAAAASLDEAQLRKALWTVYWRGPAAVRERIEEILSPETAVPQRRSAPSVPDPGEILAAVRQFTDLVRSGAYIAGSRTVTPNERSRWRFTFRRLLADARAALAAPDPAGAEEALAVMIDLACELRDYDYVRSEDPVEAAAVVVSDEIETLWRHLLDRHGFEGFVAAAAGQFVRWESRFGWTRSGWGAISQRERRLSDVLAGVLTVPDTWVTFTERYLEALDGLVLPPPVVVPVRARAQSYQHEQRRRELERQVDRRTEVLVAWHLVLLERFAGTEDEPLLDRLADHAALGGPEQAYLRARLAQVRGDLAAAHRFIHEALGRLPGHTGFIAFAREIGAPLPPNVHVR